MSAGAKWAIGLGLTALVAGGIYLATKGKKKINLSAEQENKIKELISSGKIDEKTAETFKALEGLEGNTLIKTAYEKFAKAMGYEKYPPLVIRKLNSTSSSSHGMRITIDAESFKSKEVLFSNIRHELEHFRQDDLIYRAFGKDTWLDALADSSLNRLKYNEEFCIEKFGKKFSELTNAEIEAYKNTAKQTYSQPERIKLFDSLLKAKGTINKGSKEYKEAEELLKAIREYVTPSMLTNEPLTAGFIKKLKAENPEKYKLMQNMLKKYKNNLLEVRANAKGDNIKDKYSLFRDALK